MDEVVTACFRRSLCYPLYRNWELSMKVFEDVKKVLALGQYKLRYELLVFFFLASFYYFKHLYVQERNLLSKSSVKYIAFLTVRMNQDTY